MTQSAGQTGQIDAEATVSWAGWSGQVNGGSGVLRVPTATQVELGGPGEGTNPEELLAAALANCYTSTITAHARARKLELVHIETKARTRLAWDKKTPHHIAQGTLSVRIRTPVPEALVLELANEARDHCPICNVLGATAKVTLSVSVVPDHPGASA
ncbi:MAG: lipoyl-dependent peroxiredoxin [Rhodospirillaceae bacterium]|jgi:osmotically inducible protein OsmC|nr:lipoyl-dependent peroxiredoxin [Rhodospirillaceae bacterium]